MSTSLHVARALLGFVVIASLGAFGCGKSLVKPPSETLPGEFAGAPDWVVRGCDAYGGSKKGVYICGVGSMGGTRNISLARTTAVARGRTEIARSLQVTVKAMIKDYQSTTTGGEQFGTAASDEQNVTDVSKQITDFSLAGPEMKEVWVSQNGTLYALVVLDLAKFQQSVKEMKNLSQEIRQAIEERAKDAFSELGKEIKQERRANR